MLRCRSGGAVQSKEYGPCNVALPHVRRRDRAPLGQWTYHLRIGLDRTKYVARYLLQALLPDRPAWGRCDCLFCRFDRIAEHGHRRLRSLVEDQSENVEAVVIADN